MFVFFWQDASRNTLIEFSIARFLSTRMQAVDHLVLQQISDWVAGTSPCWLATVVATYGSSPRPVGSIMACNTSGKIVGSLSGGCVEDDLLEKLRAGFLAVDRPSFFRYGEDAEEAEKLGLPCGGHLDIVVEPIEANALNGALFSQVARRVADRKLVQRSVDLRQGTILTRDVDSFQELIYNSELHKLVQVYGPRYQLFLIGAGIVSRYVAQFASALDYQIIVCDPRQDVLDEFDVPAVQKICDMPDDAIRNHAQDAQTAILALTHDPRIDDMGLIEALETDAFYVGAMGSSRTSANRRERLLALDVAPSRLRRLHAPIGLPIGSKTPPEIAISILAEIVQVRQGLAAPVASPVAAQSA